MKLHQVYILTEIAYRYYNIARPEKRYTREQARKQYVQDRNIDKNILLKVFKLCYFEQITELKTKKKWDT